MKYLMRAARRLEAGAAAARPAIPSRSPLAEADQRLNFDSFASHFDLPSVTEKAAPPLTEGESGDAPSAEREFAASRPDEARKLTEAGRPATTPRRAGRAEPRDEAADTPPRARPRREAPAHASPQTSAHTARRDEQPARSNPETSSASEGVNAAPTLEAPGPSRRRANALPDPSAGEGRTGAHGPAGAEGLSAAKAKQAPAAEATESVFDALSRAMSWVESGARRAREEGRADEQSTRPAPSPRTRPGEASTAWPARPTPRDTRPVTHLEIGKIEVEVVAPPKPAHNSAPPRPASGSDGFSKALRQTFGWRQR